MRLSLPAPDPNLSDEAPAARAVVEAISWPKQQAAACKQGYLNLAVCIIGGVAQYLTSNPKLGLILS